MPQPEQPVWQYWSGLSRPSKAVQIRYGAVLANLTSISSRVRSCQVPGSLQKPLISQQPHDSHPSQFKLSCSMSIGDLWGASGGIHCNGSNVVGPLCLAQQPAEGNCCNMIKASSWSRMLRQHLSAKDLNKRVRYQLGPSGILLSKIRHGMHVCLKPPALLIKLYMHHGCNLAGIAWCCKIRLVAHQCFVSALWALVSRTGKRHGQRALARGHMVSEGEHRSTMPVPPS